MPCLVNRLSPVPCLLDDADFSGMAYHGFFRRGIPLLFFPPDRKTALLTLSLYLPQTRAARLATIALRAMRPVGCLPSLLPRLHVPKPAEPSFPFQAEIAAGLFGFLVCNPDHGERIIAVHPCDDRSSFKVVKMAEISRIAPLKAERDMLARLDGFPGVPHVSAWNEDARRGWFSLPYLCACSTPPIPEELRQLTDTWYSTETKPLRDTHLFRGLAPHLSASDRTRLAELPIRAALVHGDFAPWNWRRDEAGHLCCIDWEWTDRDGFAGFDLVYAMVQEAMLVRKIKGRDELLSVIRNDCPSAFKESIAASGLSLDDLVSLVLAYRIQRGIVL